MPAIVRNLDVVIDGHLEDRLTLGEFKQLVVDGDRGHSWTGRSWYRRGLGFKVQLDMPGCGPDVENVDRAIVD